MINNKNGYSVIIAIFIIGFLFVLTASILKLVLVELNDNRGRDNYLKAFYGAEGASEYAMLKIKENGYGYYNKINLDKNNKESTILSSGSIYNGSKDPLISYDINSKVGVYNGELPSFGYDVIPLFYSDDTVSNSGVVNLDLSIDSGVINDISWNLISSTGGLAGIGGFTSLSVGLYKIIDLDGNFLVEDKSINDFFQINKDNFNYLVLFNSGDSGVIRYTLDGKGAFFTKPRTDIYVSGKMGDYKQNLSIKYDNTDYLGMLKYSIFSE